MRLLYLLAALAVALGVTAAACGTSLPAQDCTGVGVPILFGSIYEHVEDGEGTGLPGVDIHILDFSRADILAEATTDSAGRFELLVCPETWEDGTYIIRGSKVGYESRFGGATLRSSSKMPFSVALPKANSKEYTVSVDDYDRSLDWYYNHTGGDRGRLNAGDIGYAWDGDSVTATVQHNPGLWTWGGMWYSPLHPLVDNQPVDFKNVLGPYIRSECQGKITEFEIAINGVSSESANLQLELKVEFKNETGNTVYQEVFPNLISHQYPHAFTIDVDRPQIQKVKEIVWVMDKAVMGDSITVDSIGLKAAMPDLPTEEQAFLWSYGWLMANYDSASGLVQDRSNFKVHDMENISATAIAAKNTYYAFRKGYVAEADAAAIITGMAHALLGLPRGPAGLWPHFTHLTGGGVREIIPGTEWASGDTAFAALDIIAALQMVGDPQNQIADLEDILQTIHWEDLLLPNGSISHGFDYGGSLLPNGWRGFGMETVGVNWAYASVTGQLTPMDDPPSDNGSGFIDNAQYPMVLSGMVQGVDWTAYRLNMANQQIGWYCQPEHLNTYLCDAGLFGLSAAENPEGDAYHAYGVGGRTAGVDDGDHEVIVLHYGGMIADIKCTEAKHMWEVLRDGDADFLQDKIILSPLNNLESLRVARSTGQVTANRLKGSWNLALQAEGWAQTDSRIRHDLRTAIEENALLKRGYDCLHSGLTTSGPPD